MVQFSSNKKDSGEFYNAAAFLKDESGPYFASLLEGFGALESTIVVSNDPAFAKGLRTNLRLTCQEFGLTEGGIEADHILSLIQQWTTKVDAMTAIIVDMDWVFTHNRTASVITKWGLCVEGIIATTHARILNCYDATALVEEQVQAAMAAHRQFLAPSGLYRNAYWVPENVRRSTLDQQLSFILGRLVPDYSDIRFFNQAERLAARGIEPDWLKTHENRNMVSPLGEAWQICCLGQLRIYRGDHERIDWKLKGGAPKKTRTLFAYMLTKGEKGVHADRLAELLWPEGDIEDGKRARLHHTIAMLRKTLGHKDSVLRSGDYYRLNIPEGSWIDINSFEQLCRRGISLFKRGQLEEALQIYRSAEQLYVGDLFQDIPDEYMENDQEDWCLPRRTWLREMAIKLQRDMSRLLRSQGRLRQALEHCQKALLIDPLNDDVNIETMHVFHAQGRIDAIARQFRQYRKAMEQIEATVDGAEVHAVYLALTRA